MLQCSVAEYCIGEVPVWHPGSCASAGRVTASISVIRQTAENIFHFLTFSALLFLLFHVFVYCIMPTLRFGQIYIKKKKKNGYNSVSFL